MNNMQNLFLDPVQARQLLAQMIKMRQLGPVGDRIVEILDPQGKGSPIPPQAMAAIQQAQQEAQALNEYAKQIEAKAAELQQKLDSKTGNEKGKGVKFDQVLFDKKRV